MFVPDFNALPLFSLLVVTNKGTAKASQHYLFKTLNIHSQCQHEGCSLPSLLLSQATHHLDTWGGKTTMKNPLLRPNNGLFFSFFLSRKRGNYSKKEIATDHRETKVLLDHTSRAFLY